MTYRWQDDAVCAQTDPDLFFPEQGAPAHRTLQVCAVCPVQAECLDYALTHDERHGVWGGTSERQRDRLRRAQHNGRAAA